MERVMERESVSEDEGMCEGVRAFCDDLIPTLPQPAECERI